MKKILFAVMFALALSFSAFAQENQPVVKNFVGGYFVYDRSDSQSPENSVGAGITGNRNLFFNSHPVSFQADFLGYDDQAYAGTGFLLRGELRARTPLGIKYDFVGQNSEVYAVGSVALDHQSGGRNFFSPAIGAGFKTGDNVLTEYTYIIKPNKNNSIQGHQVTVQYTRPLKDNPNWNVYTRFQGTAGRFNFGPQDPQALSNVVFSIGISKNY